MPDTTSLILNEMQLLRRDFNDFARDTGERVAALETDMHGLMGNGQPGRVALMENAIDALSQWRWWMLGCAAGGGGVISALSWVIIELHK
jgi:hypothetical protein